MSRFATFTSNTLSSDSLNGLVFPLSEICFPFTTAAEGRLHVPVDVIFEVRQERDADPDPPDLVAGFLRPVVEVDASVENLYVVKGIL